MPSTRRPDRANEWWVDFRYAGRRIRKKSPVQTKTGADAFERVLRKRLLDLEAAGISPFRESETIFEVFVDRWMKDYVAVRNRPATIRTKCEVGVGVLGRRQLESVTGEVGQLGTAGNLNVPSDGGGAHGASIWWMPAKHRLP